ncbi:MAG: hypothetical protein GY710_11330 [Desulfobacteraceae bacterium]|nr:hypothetical protein [Desulfobacteraceae bacterium]
MKLEIKYSNLISQFVYFIIDEACKLGRDKIFFLSREGKIFLDVYEKLSKVKKTPPEAIYLPISRRAVSVATMYNKDDIFTLTSQPMAPCNIVFYFNKRFGLDEDIVAKLLIEQGVDTNKVIHMHNNGRLIYSILEKLSPIILKNAAKERAALLAFYSQLGLESEDSPLVVDIGYKGSIQSSLQKLYNNKKNFFGLYLLSQPEIKKNIGKNNYAVFKKFRPGDLISKNLLFLEFLSMANHGSFIFAVNDKINDRCYPAYRKLSNGENEQLDFTENFQKRALVNLTLPSSILPKARRINLFKELLTPETSEEIEQFIGMAIDDDFGGTPLRFIIAPEFQQKKMSKQEALYATQHSEWNAAVNVLLENCQLTGELNHLKKAYSSSWQRKLKKLFHSPGDFLFDSKYPLLRTLSILLSSSVRKRTDYLIDHIKDHNDI